MLRSSSWIALLVLAVAITIGAVWLAGIPWQPSGYASVTVTRTPEGPETGIERRMVLEKPASSEPSATMTTGTSEATVPTTASTSPQRENTTVPFVPTPALPGWMFVRGTVRRPDGSPAPGSEVYAIFDRAWFSTQRATADASGAFVVGPFELEEVEIWADAADGSSFGETRAKRGSEDVIVQLVATGEIDGRVVDMDGSPIADARVLVLSRRFDRRSWGTKTDRRGEFEMESLGAGSYAVTATLADGRIGVAHEVMVPPNRRTREVRVEMRPGGRLNLAYFGAEAAATCRVRMGDAVVSHVYLERGLVNAVTVPIGDVVVYIQSDLELVERSVRVPEDGEASVMLPRGGSSQGDRLLELRS